MLGIFTNYNNSKYTKEAVHSLHQANSNTSFYVVVVDNQSDTANREALKEIANEYTNVHLVLNDVNVGYFRGLNIGIKYLKSLHKDIENVIIGNNDLLFPNDFFSAFHKILPLLQNHAVISPDVITLDGVHQNPHVIKTISKFRELVYDIYYLNYYLALIINYVAKITKKITDRKDEEEYNITHAVFPQPHRCLTLFSMLFHNQARGATMMLKKEFINSVIPFYDLYDKWIYVMGLLYGKAVVLDEPLHLYRVHQTNYNAGHKFHSKETLLINLRSSVELYRQMLLFVNCNKNINLCCNYKEILNTLFDIISFYEDTIFCLCSRNLLKCVNKYFQNMSGREFTTLEKLVFFYYYVIKGGPRKFYKL